MPHPQPPFYIETAPGQFRSTAATGGPWSADFQHGGPPAALMLREAARVANLGSGFQPMRCSFEYLKPVPVADLQVRVEHARQGRQVTTMAATVFAGDRRVARGEIMFVRQLDVPDAAVEAPEGDPPLSVDQASPREFPFFPEGSGYAKAMELRFARGGFGLGAAAVWFRQRNVLVQGQDLLPEHALIAAVDSASGVSMELDMRQYRFMNPDLSVHLLRPPAGTWFCIDARTRVGPSGVGLTKSTVYDQQGLIGFSLQTLFVEPVS